MHYRFNKVELLLYLIKFISTGICISKLFEAEIDLTSSGMKEEIARILSAIFSTKGSKTRKK